MNNIKILFTNSFNTSDHTEACVAFMSEEAHDRLREFIDEHKLYAAFTYDTEVAFYGGVVYMDDVTDRQLMLLKLMA